MAKKIEEQLKDCKRCKKTTKHFRNSSSSGALMIVIHILLTLATAGAWLIVWIILHLLNKPIGGWKCQECGK